MARETALLVVVLVVSLAERASADTGRRLEWGLLLVVLAAAVVAVRQQFPLVALGVFTLIGLAQVLADGTAVATPLVVLVYTLSARGRIGTAAVGGAAAYAALVAAAALAGRPPSDNITGPVALVFSLTLGWSVRNRRRYQAAMIEKAERDLQAAAAEERARIARELHDVVAHGLSVMVRLSDGAAAVVTTDPSGSQAAMRTVGRIGRDSLTDMRGLLGALGGSDPAPQPQLADLADLVESYRSAGLPVVLGVAEIDASEGVQLVLYRAVQESLTNALRHADRPTAVRVRIVNDADGIVLEVTDDGRGDRASDIAGSNRGLTGLRERAAMYGGAVTAGPRADARGWAVRMQLPRARAAG